ncbi:MAG: MarR family transcriptional regulator [Rhodospirillaceae bacterium]|nr:MarR family transcriptional regulator [Rhodospirillaceae bacterium]
MAESAFDGRVAAVRRFNRFYTQRIGVLREGLLDSAYSLAEARVLYELAHRERPTASELARELGLDPGYLSRILARFQRKRLVAFERSRADGRKNHIELTAKGQRAFAPLDIRSRHDIGAWLGVLPAAEQERLVGAMKLIEDALAANPEPTTPYILRPHRPGDMGWVIGRHGAIYADEYGWDDTFEAMVAEIAARFINRFDPKRERCWIAERDGENVGAVFLVRKSDKVAQLRMLLVERKARGLGIGQRLVDECIAFARECGYRKIMLWTNDILHAARHIYEARGFKLIREEKHHSFGHDLVGQFWELKL